MSKQKVKTKELRVILAEFEEKDIEFFWQFTNPQLEKIGRKVTDVYNKCHSPGYYDECGNFRRGGSAEGEYYTKLKKFMHALEMHAVERVIMELENELL